MQNIHQYWIRLQTAVTRPPTHSVLWIDLVAGTVFAVNLAGLMAYQHYLGVDLPTRDEWRFVERLQELQQSGMLHYLFARDGVYFAPVEFLIWYLFYALTHLDIMLIRYTGAVVSAVMALLVCVMLYRKAARNNILTWAVICITPFIVCSFNFWSTYSISIESLIKPLIFAVALATCWVSEGLLHPRVRTVWVVCCIAGALVASGIFPPGLMLLPAIILARFLLRPRIDWTLLMLGLVAASLLAAYLLAGRAVGSSGALPSFTLHDLWICVYSAFGLMGNALFSPHTQQMGIYTRFIGVLIFGIQIAGMIYVIRQPIELRSRYMIPIALSLYNAFITLEIVGFRFHFPGFEFYDRYAMVMLAGPISVLFWMVMVPPKSLFNRSLNLAILSVIVVAVSMADVREYHTMPYRRDNFIAQRQFLSALNGTPNINQQRKFHITNRILPMMYPGVIYLRDNHLAMYRKK
ncbi:MAG: hypothetical protein ACRD22_06510 [Terriglobia bacterium]